jgi:hypothetical protein
VLSGLVPTFAWRARADEELLSRTFGERYEADRQRTKMIIPYLLQTLPGRVDDPYPAAKNAEAVSRITGCGLLPGITSCRLAGRTALRGLQPKKHKESAWRNAA